MIGFGEIREALLDAKDFLQELRADLVEDAEDWADGRNVWLRLPLLLYLGYAGSRHVFDSMYRSWFAGLTLVIHEGGHLLFLWFGNTLQLLGGSILQLFVPAFVALYFVVWQRDYFGSVVGLAWLAFSTWELATYVGDANRESLPLVSFGEGALHDWSTLLTRWHLLNHCELFASLLRVAAFALWVAALVVGGWLCWKMFRSRTTLSPL